MILISSVETTTGGFFDRQRRETYRTEWQETYQFGLRNAFGAHQFKIGTDFAHSDYDGRIEPSARQHHRRFKSSHRKYQLWAGFPLRYPPERNCVVPRGQMDCRSSV